MRGLRAGKGMWYIWEGKHKDQRSWKIRENKRQVEIWEGVGRWVTD